MLGLWEMCKMILVYFMMLWIGKKKVWINIFGCEF